MRHVSRALTARSDQDRDYMTVCCASCACEAGHPVCIRYMLVCIRYVSFLVKSVFRDSVYLLSPIDPVSSVHTDHHEPLIRLYYLSTAVMTIEGCLIYMSAVSQNRVLLPVFRNP